MLSPVASTAAGTGASSAAMQVTPMGWTEFHSTPGNCSMMFPAMPEHISAADKQTVFMLLVAQYPDFVDETYAQMSLEGFLNGILTHNPGNQLLFADLLLVQGHEALDFFIKTGGVYFKGRAVMVKNSLYLMAMECEIPHYDEVRYKHFVESFKLHAIKASSGN
jgi:hypothetical protein